MDPIARNAKYYVNAAGKNPFREWLTRGIDGGPRAKVNTRIRRIGESGNYGDCEPVGDGVYELRLDVGPGYLVYFGIDGNEIILLGGGDKSTQVSDITKAKDRWKDYDA
ncbi:MAG: type II toxin-antitoxin system RelE/ParE family toxin [Bryobacteraceae bacterium]